MSLLENVLTALGVQELDGTSSLYLVDVYKSKESVDTMQIYDQIVVMAPSAKDAETHVREYIQQYWAFALRQGWYACQVHRLRPPHPDTPRICQWAIGEHYFINESFAP